LSAESADSFRGCRDELAELVASMAELAEFPDFRGDSGRDGWAVRVLLAASMGGRGDCLVRMVGGCAPDRSLGAAAGSRWGDSSSCRRIPADSTKRLAADDTNSSAGDTDLPSLPNSRDCNTGGLLPSSIPTRPSPTARW
jgi:hypothetical protein